MRPKAILTLGLAALLSGCVGGSSGSGGGIAGSILTSPPDVSRVEEPSPPPPDTPTPPPDTQTDAPSPPLNDPATPPIVLPSPPPPPPPAPTPPPTELKLPYGNADFSEATSGTPTPGIITEGTNFAQRKQNFENHRGYQPVITYISQQLHSINAADAYANGWTGKGEVIAVADTGFRTDHLSLRGADKTAEILTQPRDPNVAYTPTGNDLRHGTAVASVAAGNRSVVEDDGEYVALMHGVAFDAKLHYTQIELGDGSSGYNPFPIARYDDADNARFYSGLINTPRASGARINNFSFGIRDAVSSFEPSLVRDKLARFAAVVGQSHHYDSDGKWVEINRPDADKSIIVWAAGNSARTINPATNQLIDSSTPTLFVGSPMVFTELQKNVLAVVALDNSGGIASYSNHCGVAKDFCIAAPGNLVAAYYGSYWNPNYHFNDFTYGTTGGTSFAAPTVAGALAVLRQRFPSVGNTELVARIKNTANRSGRYADSDIYGVGLLDLGAAVNDPVGGVEMDGMALQSNALTPGFSFGDALQTAFSGQLVTSFDQLLTPFEYNLGGFVKNQNPSSLNPLRAFHQDWHRQLGAENGVSNGFGAAGFALNSAPKGSSSRIISNPNSHLSLAQGGVNFALKPRNGIAFSLFNTAKKDGTPTTAGLGFAWQKTANFGVGGGVVRENEMALQSRGEGVFGGLNANTFFFGIAGKRKWQNWQFHAGAEAGAVFVDGDYWLDDVSTLLTSSLSADATRKLGDRNTLRLGISSPLRVEHGDANLTLPAGRTRYRELLHRKITPSLVPTGRQIDLTATWSRKLPLPNARVYASLRSSLEPGHRKTADSELSALLSLELDF